GVEKNAGSVEEGMRLVQVRGAHRQIPCVHVVSHAQRSLAGRALPRVLRDLCHRDTLAFRLRMQLDHVARELAHEITARDPRGQTQNLTVRRRIRYGASDGEQMRAWIARHDPVLDGLTHGGERMGPPRLVSAVQRAGKQKGEFYTMTSGGRTVGN